MSRLGRGLNQLFKDNYLLEEQLEHESVVELNLSELIENPYQPRTTFDEEKIDELAQSIKEYGVLQPIIVKKSEIGYYIVAGERRFRACKKLGLETIPAIVREIDEQLMAEIALLENLQRENLTLIEEALAYKRLIDKHGYTQQDVASRVGKSRSHITNVLRMLNLPTEIQTLIAEGKLDFGHAKILAGINDPNLVLELGKRVVAENLSVRALEQLLKEDEPKIVTVLPKKGKVELDVNLQFLQEELVRRLGTAVKIQKKDQGGKLIIDFTNDQDLNRILDIMKLTFEE